MKIYEMVFDSNLMLKNNKEKRKFMMMNLKENIREKMTKKLIKSKKKMTVMNHK